MILPLLSAFLKWKISKKLATDHVCANKLTSFVPLNISNVQFISQKVCIIISVGMAGCKALILQISIQHIVTCTSVPLLDSYLKINKISHQKLGRGYIVMQYLPGNNLLQFRRLKPDIAFSRSTYALGIPLLDVLRRHRFLKTNKQVNKCIKT